MRAAGVLVCVAACLAPLTTGSSSSSCSSDELAVYRVFLDTHWSRELFPKQYPEWRPPAGWSKLIGRTHDSSYQLFREGEQASAGLQLFAEKGQSDGLEAAEHAGVYDEFTAPPVPRGVGRSVADFFLDGNHTLVSVMVRVVPSPDWFIGVDSLDLCRGNHWIDSIAIEVDPMDAGTDNGFTFTAPNWPSEPKEPIARITSKRPSHPANSFFYPKLDKLPSIATLTFIKCRHQIAVTTTTTTTATGVSKSVVTLRAMDANRTTSTPPPPPPPSSLSSMTATATITATKRWRTDLSLHTSSTASSDELPERHDTRSATVLGSPSLTRPRSVRAVPTSAAASEHTSPEPTERWSSAIATAEPPVEEGRLAAAFEGGQVAAGQDVSERSAVHMCPARDFVATRVPTFAQTKMDDIDDLLEERVYHLSTEATRGRDPLLDGNEISNELPPGLGLSLGPLDSTESAIRRTSKTRRSKKGQAKHCQVSEWSPWSACSVSCGVGDATRTRRVLEHPRRGGRACPPLQEQRWCGGHSECPQNFFNW